jgi:hypothetical protein
VGAGSLWPILCQIFGSFQKPENHYVFTKIEEPPNNTGKVVAVSSKFGNLAFNFVGYMDVTE